MKKRIKIILAVLIVLIVGFIIGKKIYWNYKVAHAEKIVKLSTKKVEIYKENVKLKDLIETINGKLDTNPKIKTDKLGKQKVKFKYTTDEGYPVKHEVEVEIVDTTPPMIFYGKTKSIYTDFEGDLVKEFFCGDKYDPNPKCSIEGEYNTKVAGTYNVKFIGEDSSGNTAANNFKLIVKERPRNTTGGGTFNEDYTDFNEIKDNYKKDDKTHIGIDVSHWQGDINFQAVKDSGVEFAYIRAGRGDGIGKDYVTDTKFEQNIKGFNEVGIPVGVYFYSNANSKEDAKKEAKWLIDKVKNYKVDLELIFDWENWNDFQYYDLSFYSLSESYQEFSKEVSKKGYKSMLYSSKNYLENVWFPTKDSIWIAHYTRSTDYANSVYKVWQLCDDGKVNGINGYVDLNVRYDK